MRKFSFLLLALCFSACLYSQGKGNFLVKGKALDIGVYDPAKVVKHSFQVLHDDEAEEAFEVVRLQDEELRDVHFSTWEGIDEEGHTIDCREWEVVAYYPEAGVVMTTGGHGYLLLFDIIHKRSVYGEPPTYAYSPSGRYRLSYLLYDSTKHFHLDEKTENGYLPLSSVYFDGIVSGYYWVDDETIHYLRERKKPDGSVYWVAYEGKFVEIP